MARPVMGTDLVDELEGTEEARKRLKTILDQMNGEQTVEQACAELDVARSTFFDLRNKALSAALSGLSPRPRGRPAARADVEEMEGELAAIKDKHERELMALEMANLKQELRLVFPQEVIGTPEYEAEKKNGETGGNGSSGSRNEASCRRGPTRGGDPGPGASGQDRGRDKGPSRLRAAACAS